LSLVLVVYYFVAQSFGGRLAELTMGDCTLVLAFTLVGSAVQLPAVGGGSQALAIFCLYKSVRCGERNSRRGSDCAVANHVRGMQQSRAFRC